MLVYDAGGCKELAPVKVTWHTGKAAFFGAFLESGELAK
jgi:hypothetical protein